MEHLKNIVVATHIADLHAALRNEDRQIATAYAVQGNTMTGVNELYTSMTQDSFMWPLDRLGIGMMAVLVGQGKNQNIMAIGTAEILWPFIPSSTVRHCCVMTYFASK